MKETDINKIKSLGFDGFKRMVNEMKEKRFDQERDHRWHEFKKYSHVQAGQENTYDLLQNPIFH